MGNHRLWGMRCYLSGAMDRAEDGGKQWREEITPDLERLGIVVLNPYCKPIYVDVDPKIKDKKFREGLKQEGQYNVISKSYGRIRSLDLRLTSLADFLIVNIDMDIHLCGTYEELCLANGEGKPILIRCAQGKEHMADWVFGMISHEHVFGEWGNLIDYLHHVHSDAEGVYDFGRWIFFDYSQLVPKISIEKSEHLVDL